MTFPTTEKEIRLVPKLRQCITLGIPKSPPSERKGGLDVQRGVKIKWNVAPEQRLKPSLRWVGNSPRQLAPPVA